MNIQLKESLISTYDGKSSDELLRHIPEISCYNHNYYIGAKREGKASNDLIYAESNDDDFSDYHLVSNFTFISFGYSFTSEGDVIHFNPEY